MGEKVKKVRYKRSTPVGRLRRNAAKVSRHAGLVLARMASWGTVTEPKVRKVKSLVDEIIQDAASIDRLLGALETNGFVVPKRSSAITFIVGQKIAISKKHRAKYRAAYSQVLKSDPHLLDDLVVTGLLPSGEVVVQRGQRTPFMVPKSHLSLVKA